MRLTALLGVGILAAGTLGAIPAEAQRYGYDGYGHHRGYGNGYGYRGGHGYRGNYGYRNGYGYHGGYRHDGYGRGYYRHGYYGRPRVVCRLHPGRFGPVRRCFRAY